MITIAEQPPIIINRTPLSLLESNPQNGVIQLKRYQSDAFNMLSGHSLRRINTPTGSGKSYMIKALSCDDISQGKKCFIAIPQLDIGSSFVGKSSIQLPNGEIHDFEIPYSYDLVHNKSDQAGRNSTQRAMAFIKAKRGPSVMLCTHRTLILLHKQLTESDELGLWDDCSVFIDEAHHVKIHNDTKDIINVINGIGSVINHCVNNTRTSLTLVTATFFRGDSLDIIPRDKLESFKTYHLPYDEYFKYMKHLNRIRFNISLFDKSPIEGITAMHSKYGRGKEIVYIPHVRSSTYMSCGYTDATKSKYQMTKDVLDVYMPNRSETSDNNVYVDGDITGVDLVDDSTKRSKALDYLKSTDITHCKNKSPDVIVALNLAKEGADYPRLDTCHIIGNKGSFTELIQIIGRILRDVPDKHTVNINLILPSKHVSDDFNDDANTFLKAVILTMMMEEVLVPSLVTSSERVNTTRGNGTLIDSVGGADQYSQIFNDIIHQSMTCDADTEISEIVDNVLIAYGVDRDPELISHFTGRLHRQITQRIELSDKLSCDHIMMDLIKSTTVAGLQHYVCDYIGDDVFEEMRHQLRKSNESLNVEAIKRTKRLIQLHEQNGRYPADDSANDEHLFLARWRLTQTRARKIALGQCTNKKTLRWHENAYDYAISQGHYALFAGMDNEAHNIDVCKEVITFISTHDRLPLHTKDSSVEEKRLHKWISEKRMAYKHMIDPTSIKGKRRPYYNVLTRMIEPLGYGNIFSYDANTFKTILAIREAIAIYKKLGYAPAQNHPEYGSLFKRMSMLRLARKGMSDKVWHDEYLQEFKKADCMELLEPQPTTRKPTGEAA